VLLRKEKALLGAGSTALFIMYLKYLKALSEQRNFELHCDLATQ
jgi:hypothetical protein